MPRHLEDDEEFRIPLPDLIEHGRQLFAVNRSRPISTRSATAWCLPIRALSDGATGKRVSRVSTPLRSRRGWRTKSTFHVYCR